MSSNYAHDRGKAMPVFAPPGMGGAPPHGSINLDDIFSDYFTPPTSEAMAAANGRSSEATDYAPNGAGSYGSAPAPRGPPPPAATEAPASAPGSMAAEDPHEFSDDDGGGKRAKTQDRNLTEQQKLERRERNREHAKRSRVRKKFLLESLQQSVNTLQDENTKLRAAIKNHMSPDQAEALLSTCSHNAGPLIASNSSDATRILDDPDYSLVKALQTAQQNFVITDPSLPDNPIVFASQGFLTLTGYALDQILGRNCRFLQGPETDPAAVEKIRHAINQGVDASVCLLNYRIDGTTFWNQFFIAPLRDSDGMVVNYVGVQCKVSDDFARALARSEGGEKTFDNQYNAHSATS